MKDITRMTSTLYGTGSRRYTSAARSFHWITALIIFAIVPLGWIFAEFKTQPDNKSVFEAPIPGSPADYSSLHKTLGLLIIAIVVARIAYRIANPPPALPGRMAEWEKVFASASHWLLYAILIVMPVSGYIMSSGGKYPISIVGLFDFPKLPVGREAAETAKSIHLYAQYALYGLVILHVFATVWHLVVRRDGILDRMLPRQANAD